MSSRILRLSLSIHKFKLPYQSRDINVGIIGAGRIGRVHAESVIRAGAKAVVISDINAKAAKETAEKFGIPKWVTQAEDVVGDPQVDAVLICSPTHAHADQIELAAKNRKHIFCEKPVHLELDVINYLIPKVKSSGVKLMLGYNRRFDANFKRIKSAILSGEIGNLHYLRITSRDPNPPPIDYVNAVMFFIFFLAFAQLGYLLFGSQVQAYSSLEQAVFSLFRTILGDFDFDALQQANRVLGPAFFILYVFFVFFILLNMFLAIINDTYAEVKSDLAEQKNEFEMGEYFKKGAFKMLEKMNIKKEKLADINGAMAFGDANGDGNLDFEEWRLQMKQRGYADAEIEAVFAKYDVNGDRSLDCDEQRKMQTDLSNQEAAIDREYQQVNEQPNAVVDGVSREEVVSLKERVVNVERSVDGVLSKVDSVLSRLDFNEKSQMKRRDVLTKLLNPLIQTGEMPDDQSKQELLRLIRDELIHDSSVARVS